MGVCYFMVREDNRTVFELGKGTWNRFPPEGHAVPLPAKDADLVNLIGLALPFWTEPLTPTEIAERRAYWSEIAVMLRAFAGNAPVFQTSDCGGAFVDRAIDALHDTGSSGYTEVGTRYSGCGRTYPRPFLT